jgi:hypothetical protein
MIGANDLFIAAHAGVQGLTLRRRSAGDSNEQGGLCRAALTMFDHVSMIPPSNSPTEGRSAKPGAQHVAERDVAAH